jgi:hypothetical protein
MPTLHCTNARFHLHRNCPEWGLQLPVFPVRIIGKSHPGDRPGVSIRRHFEVDVLLNACKWPNADPGHQCDSALVVSRATRPLCPSWALDPTVTTNATVNAIA